MYGRALSYLALNQLRLAHRLPKALKGCTFSGLKPNVSVL